MGILIRILYTFINIIGFFNSKGLKKFAAKLFFIVIILIETDFALLLSDFRVFYCNYQLDAYNQADMDNFFITADEKHIKKEKDKARELRKKGWWKNKLAEGVCYYCGGKFPPAELTMDHVVPVARGGFSTKGNVVPACKECNSKKKYMLPIEWAEYIDNLNK